MSDEITSIAALADGPGKHSAFMHAILGEPIRDVVFMVAAVRDEPLTEAEMRYVAERWSR